MKKISKILVLTVALSVAATAGVFAQNLDTMEGSFGKFSKGVAQTLPFASTTGLEWSDAKVRGFPRFGVGLSVGAVLMPSTDFKTLAKDLDYTIPDVLENSLGVPFPAYTLDARIGIPLLPIDVGAKAGLMTDGMASAISTATGGIEADYKLLGFDVRYGIIDGGVILPALTVSAGYNYMSGNLAMDVGLESGTQTYGSYTIKYEDTPKLRFAWESQNLDFKLQASKGLLIFTPSVGVGYTHGFSSAGGGLKAEIDDSDVSDIEQIKEEYGDIFDDQGFAFLSSANGGAFRAFVGTQINLAIFKIDLNAKYNFMSESFGGGLNLRVQI